MNTSCGTCKHWDKEESIKEDVPSNIRLCNKTVHKYDAMEFVKISNDDYIYVTKKEYKNQMMFTQDGSDYRADLYTRNDFFYAHFEYKD